MPESELAFRFQTEGDLEALVAFGKSLGYEEAKLRLVLATLQPVFDAVSIEEQPRKDELDLNKLLEYPREAAFVIRMMSVSHSPAMKSAGIHLAGLLNIGDASGDL